MYIELPDEKENKRMDSDIKLEYTEAAKLKLKELTTGYIKSLDKILKDVKHIPGEKNIEVTASDLERVSKYLRFINPRRTKSSQMVFQLYAFMGIIMTLIGLFWKMLHDMMLSSPEQVISIFGGLIMTIVGIWGYVRVKNREKAQASTINDIKS